MHSLEKGPCSGQIIASPKLKKVYKIIEINKKKKIVSQYYLGSGPLVTPVELRLSHGSNTDAPKRCIVLGGRPRVTGGAR